MKSKLLKIGILMGISLSTWATTFIETPISGRLDIASGAVRGTFLGSTFKKNPVGRVVTEATFQVSAVAGIEPNEIINRNTFKVSYPGGQWNGMTYKVSGSPQFKIGEDVVLMVSKGKFGYILPDLSLSKFSVKEYEGSEVLVSSIFSEKEGIGRISLDEFNSLSQEKFGTQLISFNSDKHIHTKEKSKRIVSQDLLNNYQGRKATQRKPASVGPQESDDSIPIFWFAFALGFLGFISNLVIRGKEE